MHILNGNILKNSRKSGISIGYWNIGRGFINKGKIEQLQDILHSNKVDIMAVAEVDIIKKQLKLSNHLQIKGYKLAFPNTMKKHGSARLILYYKEYLESNLKIRTELMPNDQPTIWVEIKTEKPFHVCFTYREWTDIKGEKSYESQLQRLSQTLSTAKDVNNKKKEAWIIGDMNINAENIADPENKDKLATKVRDFTIETGMTQLITNPTRKRWVNNKLQISTIDHIYSTDPSKMCHLKIIEHGASDHSIILFKRASRERFSPKPITVRSYKNFNKETFNRDLSKCNWDRFYEEEDLDIKERIFTKNIIDTMDKHIPEITFRPRTNNQPMISQTTKECMKLRDKAFTRAKLTKKEDDIASWKILRNRVTHLVLKDRKNTMTDTLSNTKTLWQAFATISNKAQDKGGPPTKLIHNNKAIVNDKEIADTMNEHFINKIKKNKETIAKQHQPYDPLIHYKKSLPDNISDFALTPTTIEEVKEIITKLKGSKGAGPDFISNFIIKTAKEIIAHPLKTLINHSIVEGKVPTEWKHALLIPLHKKGEKELAANHRPISLLPKPSILMEKIIHKQLTKHLQANKLYSPSQHGYTKDRSTITALTSMYDLWVRARNEGKITAILATDMTAAFDLADEKLLTSKLSLLKATKNTQKWFNSYLTERTQTTKVREAKSKKLPSPSAIAQGSKLGPDLFNILTKDLPNCVKHGELVLFADDSTNTITEKDPTKLKQKIEEDAKNIVDYMLATKLLLAPDKTTLTTSMNKNHTRYKEVKDMTVNIDNHIIKQSNYFKLLGVFFNSELNFNTHLNGPEDNPKEKGLIKTLATILGQIGRLKYCPTKHLKMLLNAFFQGKLLYAIEVWGGLPDHQIKHLQLLQNRALNILDKNRFVSTKEKLKNMNWLNIKLTINKRSILTLQKMRTSKSTPYFERWLNTKRTPAQSKLPEYETSQSILLKKSFLPRTTKLWNLIPEEIRMMEQRLLKTSLQNLLMNEMLQVNDQP